MAKSKTHKWKGGRVAATDKELQLKQDFPHDTLTLEQYWRLRERDE